MNEWIRVKDELPSVPGNYLCCVLVPYKCRGKMQYRVIYWSTLLKEWDSKEPVLVTHWTTVPKLPEVDND